MSLIINSHIAVHFAQTMAHMAEQRKKYKLSPVVSLHSIIAQVQSNRSIERAPSTAIRSVVQAVPAGLLRVQSPQDLEKLTEIYHKRYTLAPNDFRLNEIMFVLPEAGEIRAAAEASGYTKRTLFGVRDTQRYLAQEAKRQAAKAADAEQAAAPLPTVVSDADDLNGDFVRELSALCHKHHVTKVSVRIEYSGEPNEIYIEGKFSQTVSERVIVPDRS